MIRPRHALLLAVALPLAVGCADEGGGASGLTLTDASGQGRGGSLAADDDRRVALGARLDLRAEVAGEEATLAAVTVSDPGVLALLSTGNPFGLRAVGTGPCVVRAEDVRGRRASVDLVVAEVASADLGPSDLYPFNLTATLQVTHPEGTAPLVEHGYAILPDGRLPLVVTWRDADGAVLRGYDLATWSVAPDLAVLTSEVARRDHRTVAHGGTAGDVTLTAWPGATFALRLLPAGAAADMTVYYPEEGRVGGALALAAGEVRTVVAVVRDADGRFVLGDDGDPLAASVSSGAVARVDPPWAEPEGDVPLDPGAHQALQAARVVYLQGLVPGAATLTLSAAGVGLEVPVTVTEAAPER